MKKMNRETKSSSLSSNPIPHDLLIETILIRLPVKSLIRFKSVCKLWFSSIEDPYFKDLHYSYSLQHRLRLLVTFDCGDLVWSNPPNHAVLVDGNGENTDFFRFFFFKIVSHYRGLILYISSIGDFVVCNPVTRERLTLPIPVWSDYTAEGSEFECYLGYDRVSKLYKVLHMKICVPENPEAPEYGCARCDVITLGGEGGGVWRTIDQLPPYHIHTYHNPVAYVNGDLHWKNSSEDLMGPPDENVLVAFDFTLEKFKVIPLPECIFVPTQDNKREWFLIQAVEEGQIALGNCWSTSDVNTITIWILEDYAKQKWIRKIFNKPLNMPQYVLLKPHGVLANGQVIIHVMKYQPLLFFYYYDPVNKVSRKVEFTELHSQHFCPTPLQSTHVSVHQFVESLHSCNGKIDDSRKNIHIKVMNIIPAMYSFFANRISRLC